MNSFSLYTPGSSQENAMKQAVKDPIGDIHRAAGRAIESYHIKT